MSTKIYLPKEDRKTIETMMPGIIRKLYKTDEKIVKVHITRRKPLKRYGNEIWLYLRKNGRLIGHTMDEDKEVVAKNIVGYFLYGERGYDYNVEIF